MASVTGKTFAVHNAVNLMVCLGRLAEKLADGTDIGTHSGLPGIAVDRLLIFIMTAGAGFAARAFRDQIRSALTCQAGAR